MSSPSLTDVVSTFGLETKAKLASKVASGAPEDQLRAPLEALIKALREGSPWPHETMRLNRVIFPQMSHWLPPEEREQLCFAFEAELKRLNLAA